MRAPEEVALVRALADEGLNHSQIAREVGISRTTVRDWLAGRTPDFDRTRTYLVRRNPNGVRCPVCAGRPALLPQHAYPYLLGLYLGDGCLSAQARGVYRLRIACADRYPHLMDQCELAMAEVLPNKVGRAQKEGCTEVGSSSKHWPCLFPQHGPGRKHQRKIELVPWQQEIVDADPRPLLRGLIHSDGCRTLNWVNGTPYPGPVVRQVRRPAPGRVVRQVRRPAPGRVVQHVRRPPRKAACPLPARRARAGLDLRARPQRRQNGPQPAQRWRPRSFRPSVAVQCGGRDLARRCGGTSKGRWFGR